MISLQDDRFLIWNITQAMFQKNLIPWLQALKSITNKALELIKKNIRLVEFSIQIVHPN